MQQMDQCAVNAYIYSFPSYLKPTLCGFQRHTTEQLDVTKHLALHWTWVFFVVFFKHLIILMSVSLTYCQQSVSEQASDIQKRQGKTKGENKRPKTVLVRVEPQWSRKKEKVEEFG